MQWWGRCKDSENVPKEGPGLLPPQGHTQHWSPPWPPRPACPQEALGTVPPGLPEPAPPSPWSPFPLALVQEGGGEAWGRTTGAKALFCFTAEMTLAGENEKMPWALLQFEGRVTEEAAMVGLDGTTATKQTRSGRAAPGGTRHRDPRAVGTAGPGAAGQSPRGPSLDNRQTLCRTRVQWGGPVSLRLGRLGLGLGSQCDRTGPD